MIAFNELAFSPRDVAPGFRRGHFVVWFHRGGIISCPTEDQARYAVERHLARARQYGVEDRVTDSAQMMAPDS